MSASVSAAEYGKAVWLILHASGMRVLWRWFVSCGFMRTQTLVRRLGYLVASHVRRVWCRTFGLLCVVLHAVRRA